MCILPMFTFDRNTALDQSETSSDSRQLRKCAWLAEALWINIDGLLKRKVPIAALLGAAISIRSLFYFATFAMENYIGFGTMVPFH